MSTEDPLSTQDQRPPTRPQRHTLNPTESYACEQSSAAVTNLGWNQVGYGSPGRLEDYLQPGEEPYLRGRPVYVPRRADPNAPAEPDPAARNTSALQCSCVECRHRERFGRRYPLPPEQEEAIRNRIRKQFPDLEF